MLTTYSHQQLSRTYTDTEHFGTCSDPTASILSSDPVTNTARHAGRTLIYRECEDNFMYLLASDPAYATNYEFVVDLGCEATITAFKVRNSRNKDFNDRYRYR